MFDKSTNLFPIKNEQKFLAYCSISPLFAAGCRRQIELAELQHRDPMGIGARYLEMLASFHEAFAQLFKTSSENISAIKNTSEGMSMIAWGYPFEPGDEVVSYVHEYPANHYPWRVQEKRGVKLVLLPNRSIGDSVQEYGEQDEEVPDVPVGWSMADLEEAITDRTKVVAISHVQFASGYAADLENLGKFCQERDIDLVVDAAQSLGCMPVEPERHNIAAVVASGWKWMMGPMGTGVMYTSPTLRNKLSHVMAGAELMRQGEDYLDHTWAPHQSGKRFEYSTSPLAIVAALEACVCAVQLTYGVEAIWAEVRRLHDLFLQNLDRTDVKPLVFDSNNRSGILALRCSGDTRGVTHRLAQEGYVVSPRGNSM